MGVGGGIHLPWTQRLLLLAYKMRKKGGKRFQSARKDMIM